MGWDKEEQEQVKAYFRAKLAAEKQTVDVVRRLKGEIEADFVVVDTRDRAAFEREHIPGAICIPLEEVDQAMADLDPEKEYVTYCWHST